MAGTLNIYYGTSGVTYVNLGGTALEIAPSGFGYKTSNEPVWTVFECVSTATDADLRGELKMLDWLKEAAGKYSADATRSTPVYLNWSSSGENVRRTNVYDIEYEVLSDQNLNALLGNNAAKVRIAVQHPPFWEGTSITSAAGTVTDLGGKITLSVANTSYPSRIKSMYIAGYSGDTLDAPKTKVWAGIRAQRNGNTGFIPKWEAEHGTNATDASDIADANASNGTAVAVTFATATDMTKRFSVLWSNIATADYDHLVGKYLVLGRMRLSAGTVEVATELKHGWIGDNGLQSSLGVNFVSAVTDANLVNYNLVPLGVADIPPTGDRDKVASGDGGTNSMLRSYGLSLFAERLSAGGSMVFDCFVLVPADHLMTVGSAAINSAAGKSLWAYTGDDDISYAVNRGLTYATYSNVEYSFENWHYPVEGGVLVLAAQAGTYSPVNGTISAGVDIVQRFRGYRAA